jgi:D-beta-D-heptose 7-phosphate kinase/D-beta-D-heptose 1-phosphate adenosyltransferase
MKKVWTNGTFDVLHVGHLKLLEYAASFGQLTVGIDSDKRVKELKGLDRPFNNTLDRKYFLESLKFVHNVVVFDSREELINMVKQFEPDYMVIGSDYINKPVFGSEYAKELLFFTKLEEYSTTTILNYEKDLSHR